VHRAATDDSEQDVTGTPEPQEPPDGGLRSMLKWVFGALIITVLFGVLIVELTLRWLR
jgi:hypothetical protein